MQTGPIILVLAIALMGGGIAYMADLLGRSMGKKRLSLGRMRPKHTAALITTVTGIVIPIVTLGLLYVVSSDVREMLTDTRVAKQQLARAQENLRITEKDLDGKAQEIADLTQVKASLESAKKGLTKENAGLSLDKNRLSKEISGVRTNLRVQTKLAQNLRQQAITLQRSFKSLSASVSQKSIEVARLTKEAKDKGALSETLNRQLKEQGAYALRLDTELLKAESDLKRAESTVITLREEAEAVKRQTDATKKLFDENVRLAQEEVAKARRDYDLLNEEASKLLQAQNKLLGDVRNNDLMFRKSEEVARTIASAGSTLADARDAYESILRISRNEATKRGAIRDKEFGLTGLYPWKDPKGKVLSVAEQEEVIFKQVIGKNEPQVLIARAPLNIFVGEWLPIIVDVLPNFLVYSEGQIIAETRIDGSQTERQILDALGDFIRNKVGPKAIADNMIPRTGADAALGEVSDEEILRLVKEISLLSRFVRVQAIATEPTRRADRLKLRFNIK